MSLAEAGVSACRRDGCVKAKPSWAADCLASASARALTTSGTVPGASAARRRTFSSWRTRQVVERVLVVEQPRTVSMTSGAPTYSIEPRGSWRPARRCGPR